MLILLPRALTKGLVPLCRPSSAAAARRLDTESDLLARIPAAMDLGVQVETGCNNTESEATPSLLRKIWNERDVQIMILISLGLQLFLSFCGNLRRWRRVGEWLRLMVWLSYLGALAAATSGIGLFSQYEDKYKLRSVSQSSESIHTLTLPFLWVPFFLLHLGGQDTITAYSVEDNNLWLRLLLNLLFLVCLALYVFWMSLDLLNNLLPVAVPLFVAGICKCGERIWALKGGSRDNLRSRQARKKEDKVKDQATRRPSASAEDTRLEMPPSNVSNTQAPPPGNVVESYALKSTIASRGLLVGQTLLQLGTQVSSQLVERFADIQQTEGELKIILMELGMIYDMLYTKAMVLQSLKGRVLRGIALIAMAAAFVLFVVYQHPHASNTGNATITYALFAAAIFMELYSVVMVIVSPWTRAGYKEGTSFFFRLSRKACSGLPTPTMGQLNITDYSLSKKSTPKFIAKVLEALGLKKHWRNFWHVKHVDDKEIVDYIMGFFDTRKQFQELKPGQELHTLLLLPFEDAFFRLHIFTEMHISPLLLGGGGNQNLTMLAEECRKLSNYLMYLMVVYPSMLPVSSVTQDLEPFFTEWVSDNHQGTTTKTEILEKYANEKIDKKIFMPSRFTEPPSEVSLKELKEVWARLLIYSAGKSPMELHGRQLGEGLELLTVVWSVMMHHRVGEVGRQLSLEPSTAPRFNPERHLMSVLARNEFNESAKIKAPLYAFKFHAGLIAKAKKIDIGMMDTKDFRVIAWAPPALSPSQEDTFRELFPDRWPQGNSTGSTSSSESRPLRAILMPRTIQRKIPTNHPAAEDDPSSSRPG